MRDFGYVELERTIGDIGNQRGTVPLSPVGRPFQGLFWVVGAQAIFLGRGGDPLGVLCYPLECAVVIFYLLQFCESCESCESCERQNGVKIGGQILPYPVLTYSQHEYKRTQKNTIEHIKINQFIFTLLIDNLLNLCNNMFILNN